MTNITRAVEAIESRLKVSPTDATGALREAWPFLRSHFFAEYEEMFRDPFSPDETVFKDAREANEVFNV